MKKITMLILLITYSMGYSQTNVKAFGENQPKIIKNEQIEKQATKIQSVEKISDKSFRTQIPASTKQYSITSRESNAYNKILLDPTSFRNSESSTTINYKMPRGAKSFDAFVPSGESQQANFFPKTPTLVNQNHKGPLAITTYTDRTAFEAAYSGTFIVENFAGGPGAGAITPCGPVVSSGGDGCFPAGELEDGFSITASSGLDVIYIGAGAIGNTSTLMGANNFIDSTVINFAPDGAYAVGHDLFFSNVTTADYRVYDTGGTLLETITVTIAANTESFFGIISDDAIGRVEIQASADAGELFGNFEFGIDPVGGGTFPAPYCGPLDFTSNVEPITLVEVAGISNVTDATLNGTPDHEDFTAISGDMEQGMSYPIAMEGNTDGNFTNRFVVFIDWNQNDVLNDAGEVYEMTDLLINSTGTDGQQVNGDIDVPADALEGSTRLRVKKIFGTTNFLDPCLAASFGQAEDYSINVTAGGGTGVACSQDNPENNFENGYTTSSDQAQIIATDITVPADTDFTLNTITVNIWMNPGSTLTSSDITFYNDLAGTPGAVLTTQSGVVPVSQTVIGSNFGFDISEVVFDISPEMLAGQAGVASTYWVSLYVTISAGSGFIGATSASIEGFESYFSPDTGTTWLVIEGNDTVYNFEGECTPIGGGVACSQDNPENNFENGYTTSSDQAQIIATDITVPADTDFTLNTITVNIWMNPGSTLTSSDITFYNDLAGTPGAVLTTQSGVVPVSQTVIGSNFGFDISEVVFDISPEMLAGQAGVASTYWISLYVTISAGSGFIGATSASIEGFESYFSPDTGTTWLVIAGNDTVYNFEGQCDPIGGGGTYDDCSGAIALACGDSVTGETLTATDSGGNPAPDVFYSFTGTGSAQVVTISLCGGGTDYDSLLRVFTDCTLGTEIALNDDSCGLQSEVSFLSDGSATYYIMVEGFSSNSGNFSLDVTCVDPPENDQCSNAIAVNCGDSVAGTTINASEDSAMAPECGTPVTSPGVWYTLTDNSGLAGNITLSLCTGTAYDSKISVYTGDCGAPPLTCVTGNDDSCGLQSVVTFPSNGNDTFLILVHGFGSASGDFVMDITCTPTPPPNDMIANSIDVDEIGFPYTDPAVAMPAATTENGNPAGCNLTGANGVWYNFVPEGNGTAMASITTPGGASSVTFYTAADENAVETDLTLVPQNSNQCVPGTSASINTVAGQAYYVFVLNTGAITDIVIDGTNLGTSENVIAGFSFYPNPSTTVLNLKAADAIDSVLIYNLLGQAVIDTRVGATASQIDISALSTGTYIMQVYVNGQMGTYKVIKK